MPRNDGTGFVPNYSAAGAKSQDRSEEMIGSKVLLEIYKQYKEDWSANCVVLCLSGTFDIPCVRRLHRSFFAVCWYQVLYQPYNHAYVFAVVELLFDDCLDWLNWAHEHRRLPPLHLITQGSDNITGILIVMLLTRSSD